MSDTSRQVLDGLRAELAGPRKAKAFVDALESRVRQLLGNMVDGRVLPKPEAEALRASVLDLVRTEALPALSAKNDNDAIVVLDKLKAYGWTALEDERPRLEQQRAAKHRPPAPATWPVLEELRSASEKHPTFCVVNPPVGNVYFAASLREDGLALPDELLALYSAHDGFDLSCISDPPHIPVFSLLPGLGIDECDVQDGYPRRAACFQGGDEVLLSVYRDPRKQWWLVYEYEYAPVAKKTLDLEGLVGFGIQRMRGSFDDLNEGALSWEDYFGTRRAAASSPRPAM